MVDWVGSDELPAQQQPRMMPLGSPPGAGGGAMTQPRVTVYPERASRQSVVDFWKSKGAPEHVAEGIAGLFRGFEFHYC